MSPARIALLAALSVGPASLAAAAAPVVVNQLHRAFSVREVRIHRGEMVEINNTDEFLHHLYVASPTMTFNSGEQPPGRNVDIQFPVPGTFEVRCEIHPRMLLTVSVE